MSATQQQRETRLRFGTDGQSLVNYFHSAASAREADQRWNEVVGVAHELWDFAYDSDDGNETSEEGLRLWFAAYVAGACKDGLEGLADALVGVPANRISRVIRQIAGDDEEMAQFAVENIPAYLLPEAARRQYEILIAEFQEDTGQALASAQAVVDATPARQPNPAPSQVSGAASNPRTSQPRAQGPRESAFLERLPVHDDLVQIADSGSAYDFERLWNSRLADYTRTALAQGGLRADLPDWALRFVFLTAMETDDRQLIQGVHQWVSSFGQSRRPTEPPTQARAYAEQLRNSKWLRFLPGFTQSWRI